MRASESGGVRLTPATAERLARALADGLDVLDFMLENNGSVVRCEEMPDEETRMCPDCAYFGCLFSKASETRAALAAYTAEGGKIWRP